MATKTISITEDAYERLASIKEKNESFSEVIARHFPKRSLLELVGTLTNKEAEELKSRIKEGRTLSRKRIEKIAEQLK